MPLTICPWKYGKRWVYSITYDEALSDLHRFAVPLHEEYRIPGHVEVVVGQLGQVRNIGASSYNGFRHMDAAELKDLRARGWGIGNHSWSHEAIRPDTVEQELLRAKDVLEAAIDGPADLFCAPGNNENLADHVLAACRRYGYLGAMSITDALNLPGEELFWLNRTPLHEQYYAPFYSAFDPYRNIRNAQAEGGWIIDYCHCPLEAPIHPNKDCSQAQLRRRFETVLSEGGGDVWCAVPEEAVFYHLTRRRARVETLPGTPDGQRYRFRLPGLSDRVTCRALTVEAGVPAAWCRAAVAHVDGAPRPAEVVAPGRLRLTLDVSDGTELAFGPGA